MSRQLGSAVMLQEEQRYVELHANVHVLSLAYENNNLEKAKA